MVAVLDPNDFLLEVDSFYKCIHFYKQLRQNSVLGVLLKVGTLTRIALDV